MIKINSFRQLGKGHIVSLLTLIVLPVACHLLFSNLGFNPTDDGFTLAYSRRILEGQIPHLDFIIIRPFLSPLLHVPLVYFGGVHTYLLSRLFVWFEFACIAWLWIGVCERQISRKQLKPISKFSFALICFIVTVHSFPIMAWHTVDGLFFILLGQNFIFSKTPGKKAVGYFVLGLSYLCKQSFIFVAPLVMLILGDWRKPLNILSAVFPGILYVAYLWLVNAFPDALLQLSSQSNLLEAGLYAFINIDTLIGFIMGSVFTFLFCVEYRKLKFNLRAALFLLFLATIPLLLISSLFSGIKFVSITFYIFGITNGAIIVFFIFRKILNSELITTLMIAIVVTWCASLSIGYNYPAFGAGILLLALISCVDFLLSQYQMNLQSLRSVMAVAMAIVFAIAFYNTRTNDLYREQPAFNLKDDLTNVLPGGSGIITNENTFLFLTDLYATANTIKESGKMYSIVPDFPGYWVKAVDVNPLPIDWPQDTELGNESLFSRVISRLEYIRGNNVVIVQKYEANALAESWVPLGNKYRVVNYIRANFVKIGETRFFDLYE